MTMKDATTGLVHAVLRWLMSSQVPVDGMTIPQVDHRFSRHPSRMRTFGEGGGE